MPINLSCSCGKKLLVADTLAGKKVKCPACQSVLVVPTGATKPAPPPAKSAKPAQPTPSAIKPASAPKNGPAPPRKSAPAARRPAEDSDDEPEERPAKRRAAQRPAPTGKSKTGLLIAALLGLLLVGGGGAAGWWFFLRETPRPNPGPIAQGAKPGDPNKNNEEPESEDPEPEDTKTPGETVTSPINDLKQIALAFHAHNDVFKKLPLSNVGGGLSWRVALLPFIDEGKLYMEFKLDEPWDSEHNIKLLPKMPKVYRPAKTDPNVKEGYTFLKICTGPKTPWFDEKIAPSIPRSFPDGTSNTVVVVEAAEAVAWTKPEDIALGAERPKLGHSHPEGFWAALGDGTVAFIHHKRISDDVFRNLIDPSDGNVVPEEALNSNPPFHKGVAKSKPGDPLEIRQLPAGADGFFSVRFSDWWSGKSAQTLRKEEPGKDMLDAFDEMGVRVDDIERIQLSFFIETAPKDKFQSPVSLFAAVLAKKPMDVDRIKSKFRPGTRESAAGGKYYYHAGFDHDAPVIHFRNDRLLVAASEPIMKKYLTGGLKFNSKGFDLEPTKTKHLVAEGRIPQKFVAEVIEDAPLPKIDELRYAADLKSFRVIAHNEDALDLDVRLTFSSEAKASEIGAAAKKYVVLGEQVLKKLATSLPQGDSLEKKMVDFGVDALAKLKIGAETDTVTVQTTLAVAELVPLVLQAVEKAANTTRDINNFRQAALAFHSYYDVNKKLPSQSIRGGLSWRVAILPYIEQIALYNQFKLDEPWDSPHNIKLLPLMPPIYHTMSGRKLEPGHTAMQFFTGPKTLFTDPKKAPHLIRDMPDGTSNTIVFAEAAKGVPWTKPEDMVVDPQGPLPKLGGSRKEGFIAALGDGSCHIIPYSVDEKTLRLLIDPADGTPLNLDFLRPPPPPTFEKKTSTKKPPPPPTPPFKDDKKPEPKFKEPAKPEPKETVEPEPPRPMKPAVDQAIDWVRTNNAFGPDHKIVADVTSQLDRDAAGKGFILRLGKDLVKSDKQTLVCGWGSDLFVFELNAEQAERSPFNPKTMVLRPIEQGSRGRAELALTDVKIVGADNLDPAAPITGTLGVQLLGGEKGLEGRFAIRCVYAGGGQRVTLYKPYPSDFLIPDGKPMQLKFDSLVQSNVKHTGVLVLFLDIVRNPAGPGETAISRPRAVLVNVAAAKKE